MKVCTDSCILGAYAEVENASSILDIGTGTGLLALMAAQRSTAQITAIEIDEKAAVKAQENCKASPWADRIKIKHQSLQEFGKQTIQLFDVILCNPPFYSGSHQSPDSSRNRAMHSSDLTFLEIIEFCKKNLTPTGKLWLLLPPPESSHFTSIALENKLFCQTTFSVFTSNPGKKIRSIQSFSRVDQPYIKEQELVIRNQDHSYTSAFQTLLKDYYLIF